MEINRNKPFLNILFFIQLVVSLKIFDLFYLSSVSLSRQAFLKKVECQINRLQNRSPGYYYKPGFTLMKQSSSYFFIFLSISFLLIQCKNSVDKPPEKHVVVNPAKLVESTSEDIHHTLDYLKTKQGSG